MVDSTTQIPRSEDELMALRLPELRALFAKVTGEVSRAPNKRFLARKILEALKTQEAEDVEVSHDTDLNDTSLDESESADDAEERGGQAEDSEDIDDDDTGVVNDESTERDALEDDGDGDWDNDDEEEDSAYSGPEYRRKILLKHDVHTLRKLYVQIMKRDTKSFDRNYLVWKIREVIKGNIPAGKRKKRKSAGATSKQNMQTLPLRIERSTVKQLDAARERLALKNRMVLFRNALHDYLMAHGEEEVAALFADS